MYLTFHLFNYTDTSLRNIIDKLAVFVARNGPEFESITKAKQQGNPRFNFLFGGEFYQYYQWRVSNEQSSELIQRPGSRRNHVTNSFRFENRFKTAEATTSFDDTAATAGAFANAK